jgi:hypothetical protein
MPLWYPDVSVGPLLNVQRVRTNLFMDYGYGNSLINQNPVSQAYTSVGAEVTFDVNLFRLLPQFDIGFRYSYRVSPQTNYDKPYLFELLVGSINF